MRAALALVLAAAACGGNGPAGPAGETVRRFDPRPLEGGCPEGDPVERFDLNRDGVFDIVVVAEGPGTCRSADQNFDGRFDIHRHFDAGGNVVRQEADIDHDGRLDVVSIHAGGEFEREEFDTNWDGTVDMWVEMRRRCDFQSAAPATCTTSCGVPWCMPRARRDDEAPRESPSGDVPPHVTLVYRDSDADGLWDVAEVLFGSYPICVGFNTNFAGDTPDRVNPEDVEMYRPSAMRTGRPDIDYVKRDYLDLQGNPIVRCEDADGLETTCPSPCGR